MCLYGIGPALIVMLEWHGIHNCNDNKLYFNILK